MKNTNKILERQCVKLDLSDGIVKYFSVSTQHAEADTIEEAIKSILEADNLFCGKSWLGYIVDKYERHLLPDVVATDSFSKKDIQKATKIYRECLKKSFHIEN